MSVSSRRHRSLGPIITPTHETSMHPILVHAFYTPSCFWYMPVNVCCLINIGGSGGQSRDACEDNWHLRQSYRWTRAKEEGEGFWNDYPCDAKGVLGCQRCCLDETIMILTYGRINSPTISWLPILMTDWFQDTASSFPG